MTAPARRRADLLAALGPGAAPSWWRAPGRVNLIGDHTDYNDGFVLPLAIDRDAVLAGRVTRTGRVRVRSLEVDGLVDVAADGSDDARAVTPRWGRYVAGATQALAVRGSRLPGLDAVVSSTVPAGSGLSSSSALTVAVTVALADVAGFTADRIELARAALDGEVRGTGVPGGLMDQLTSLFGVEGHALLIDCRVPAIEPIPLPDRVTVLVVHSGVPRTLADSAYAERRRACEAIAARLGLPALRDAALEQVRDEPLARHVVTENARVLELAAALRAGDVDALGPLLLASHASLRDDYAVSIPELDLLVELLVEAGASGARLTGAGFGGAVVALARRADAARVLDTATARYRDATGREPLGFPVRAVGGAGRLER